MTEKTEPTVLCVWAGNTYRLIDPGIVQYSGDGKWAATHIHPMQMCIDALRAAGLLILPEPTGRKVADEKAG